MNKASSSTSSVFISLVLLLSAGTFLLYSQKYFSQVEDDSSRDFQINPNSHESEQIVNKYLQETNRKIEDQKTRREIENDFSIPRVGQLVPFHQNQQKNLDIDAPDTANARLGTSKNELIYNVDIDSPRGVVEENLAESQRLAKYDKEFKEAYIREFVANARKNGWIIVVDENGVVKSSKPVDKSENKNHINVFDSAAQLDADGN